MIEGRNVEHLSLEKCCPQVILQDIKCNLTPKEMTAQLPVFRVYLNVFYSVDTAILLIKYCFGSSRCLRTLMALGTLTRAFFGLIHTVPLEHFVC